MLIGKRAACALTLLCALSLTSPVIRAGDLLVSNWLGESAESNVLRFDETTGEFIGEFVTLGSGGLVAAGTPAFGPDRNLYVVNQDVDGGNDGVWRYDGQTGEFIDVFVPESVSILNGITFGPDGDLYATDSVNNAVRRYDGTTGQYLGDFVTPASGGLAGPSDLCFGPDGSLYVASLFANEVFRYDGATGGFIDIFTEPGHLSRANQLEFGPDGNLYVSSTQGGQVVRFDGTSGTLTDAFIDGLNWPIWIGFGPDANFYVMSNDYPHGVDRYDGNTGEFVDHFVTQGSGGLAFRGGFVWIPEPSTAWLVAILALLSATHLKRS